MLMFGYEFTAEQARIDALEQSHELEPIFSKIQDAISEGNEEITWEGDLSDIGINRLREFGYKCNWNRAATWYDISWKK